MTGNPGAATIPEPEIADNPPDIKLALKQFLVRTLLAFLYGLVRLRRLCVPALKAATTPLRFAGRFVLRAVGVPLYRLAFFFRRQAGRLLLPAKNRLTFITSNRYAVHAVVAALVAVAGASNLGGGEVRAETFGTGSMLYALVAPEEATAVEIVSASSAFAPARSSYLDDDGTIEARAHLDFASPDADYVTTTVGGAVSSPAIHELSPTTAPRTAVESYQVADGDTLYGIAAKFDLSLSSLLWANGMTVRSVIRPGQTVKVPPVDGVIYVVKKGDTVSKIAKAYGAEQDKIIAFNRLSGAGDLRVGEELVVPDGEPPAPVIVSRPAPVATLFAKAPAGTKPAAARGSGSGRGSWTWPTDWRVITQYYGWKHTGVDIDGDYSTQSYASADGVVIYSGWRKGYGMTVEVDHGDGLVTRYAHHSKLFVQKGDAVKAGQSLAQTGSTGRSTGTHLHFEVIKNGKFQNPLDYVR